jgi:hypothetical protein
MFAGRGMAEVHLRFDDEFVEAVNEGLERIHSRGAESSTYKTLTATEIVREALAVYRWVVERTADDQAVVAANKDRLLVSQLATRNLPARAPSGFPREGLQAPPPAPHPSPPAAPGGS